MKVWNLRLMHKSVQSLLCLAMCSVSVAFAADNNGLHAGKLPPCPDSPNCVSSELDMIEAIDFSGLEERQVWQILQQVISAQGGQIKTLRSDYLHAVFKTPVMGFVDDVQARMDRENRLVHLRSASRTGYYDFGVNRARLQKIMQAMHIALHPEILKNVYQ